MPKITFLPANKVVEVESGTPILDAALDNNIKINHNCGGNCACSTCHVIVEDGFDSMNEVSEDEMDMLDEADGLTDTSRLSCQAKVTKDIIVRIPDVKSPFDETF